jgi:hypothetical protein
VEKGMYHALKDVMKEKDEHANQWFTQDNLSNLIGNILVAGMYNVRIFILDIILVIG